MKMTIKEPNGHIEKKRLISGMTLIEMLLVVSLIGMVSIGIYNALSSGLKVWKKSNQLVIEEDVAIFFDKISGDLRNVFYFSKIPMEGNNIRFSFPTIIYDVPNLPIGEESSDLVDQVGVVEYYFDGLSDGLYRRQANYGQSQRGEFGAGRLLVPFVEDVQFRYYYLTETDELYSDTVLELIPSGVEITVEFNDPQGRKIMKKSIQLLIGD